MRFTFIAAKKVEHTVSILCRCLRVTRSGFYAWQRRPESMHARDDRRLKVLVRASFEGSSIGAAARAFTRICSSNRST